MSRYSEEQFLFCLLATSGEPPHGDGNGFSCPICDFAEQHYSELDSEAGDFCKGFMRWFLSYESTIVEEAGHA
jgi:hypothetical protein